MAEDRENTPRRPATERADELLTRAGQTAGIVASLVGMRIARVAAFAREEVEDMWAEAQSIRQQAASTEADGDVRTTASEGTDVSQPSQREAEERKPESEQSAESEGEVEEIKATPTARRRAEELGVDLQEVKGTGADGQITASDVKKKAGSKA